MIKICKFLAELFSNKTKKENIELKESLSKAKSELESAYNNWSERTDIWRKVSDDKLSAVTHEKEQALLREGELIDQIKNLNETILKLQSVKSKTK